MHMGKEGDWQWEVGVGELLPSNKQDEIRDVITTTIINAHKRKTSADGRRKGKIKQTKGIQNVQNKKTLKYTRRSPIMYVTGRPLEAVDFSWLGEQNCHRHAADFIPPGARNWQLSPSCEKGKANNSMGRGEKEPQLWRASEKGTAQKIPGVYFLFMQMVGHSDHK